MASNFHAIKRPPTRAEASTVRPERHSFHLDPTPEQLLKERFRIACDIWKRRNDGTRAQFADALGIAELTVKQWLSSDETRRVPAAIVIQAEQLAADSQAAVTDAELGRARREYLISAARLRALETLVEEAAA